MSAVDLIKGWKESNPQIKNILLFISDSLRWDYTPKSVSSRGVTFKTIASGIWTPASLSSLVTGLYPPRHGVHYFRDSLPKGISSILSLQGYNTSVWTENTWIDFDPPESSPLYGLLQHRNRVCLEELEPPFIYLEDEKGGHCPYGWSFEDEEYKEWDCRAFFRDCGKRGKEMLRERYQKGIERSVREFNSRMRVIEQRGLEEDTLVIFLSDHGELLGEYGGIVGHGLLTSPEVVYVPTVFIHPNLPEGKSFENEGVLRHVDLFPTICDILSKPITKKVDGLSLFNIEKLPNFGYTYFLERQGKKWGTNSLLNYELKEVSVWDTEGGYLFREGTGPMLRLLRAIYHTVLSNSYQREIIKRMTLPDVLRSYSATLRCLCSSFAEYGSPSFGLKKARALKTDFESMLNGSAREFTEEEKSPRVSQEKEKKIKERLRSLGYI